jgi:glycosyltransferase involved in cell wall biosynthesis
MDAGGIGTTGNPGMNSDEAGGVTELEREQSTPVLSVVICTHNPRMDYLRRTLEGLRGQGLPLASWELIVVDNCSTPPLVDQVDLGWHPRGRLVREEVLGKVMAWLRGMREAVSDVFVMVDDDNVLAPDYLEQAIRLRETMPFVHVFGAGCIQAEYEEPPEAWLTGCAQFLAVREVPRDVWSNIPLLVNMNPYGAGLCATRPVIERYRGMLEQNPIRRQLDRRGQELTSGADDDLCFTAGSLGLGVGVFRCLRLTHLIPRRRMTLEYVLRMAEAMHFSTLLLKAIWGEGEPVRTWTSRGPVKWLWWTWRWWRATSAERPFVRAAIRGERRARRRLEEARLG